MATIYILFNNDSPQLAYSDRDAAEKEAVARKLEDKREARDGYPTSYWHVHDVPIAEAVQAPSRHVCDKCGEVIGDEPYLRLRAQPGFRHYRCR